MEKFDDIVVKDSSVIYGHTTINHAVRCQLGITVNEYCVADFIEYAKSKGKMVTYEYAYRRLGILKDQFTVTLKTLLEKELIQISEPTILVTEKWNNAFTISAEWFDNFWLKNGKAIWPGSKMDAERKFKILCRKYKPEYIIMCRDAYLKFMAHPDNSFRKIMGAPVFLNPETERFKEDWKDQLSRLNNKEFPQAKKVAITAAEKEAMF